MVDAPLIESIARHRGVDTQLLKLAEEASEVAQAAIKHKMNPTDATLAKLGEELADFGIIHDQLLYLIEPLDTHEGLYRQFKVGRELVRIETESDRNIGGKITDFYKEEK